MSEWREFKLEEVIEKFIDYRGKTPKKTDKGIPLITAKIVKNGRIEKPTEFIAPEDYDSWMRRGIPQKGDVVLTTEAPLGEVAQIPGQKVALAQRIITLRGKKDILDNTFLKYMLQSPLMQHRLLSRASGTTVQGIKSSELKKVLIPIPPLNIQKCIASILKTLDDKIELNHQMNDTLEEMAMTLYKHWFVDFGPFQDGEFVESELGMIPKGWEVGCLSDIVNKINDRQKAGEHLFNLPYVPIDLLNKKNLSLSDTKPGSEAKSSLIKFCKGDILFGAMRPYFHKVCIAPFEGITRTTCFVLRPKKKFYFSFAVLTIFRDETINFADSNSKGSTIPYADWESAMANMKIVIPNDDVLYRFDEVVRPMLSLIRDSYYQNKCLKDTRNYLLPRLLSGEIDLSEAKERIQEVLNNA